MAEREQAKCGRAVERGHITQTHPEALQIIFGVIGFAGQMTSMPGTEKIKAGHRLTRVHDTSKVPCILLEKPDYLSFQGQNAAARDELARVLTGGCDRAWISVKRLC